MRRIGLICLTALMLFLGPIDTVQGAGPVRGPQKCELAWTAPTTNTDGTALTDLKSYDIYIVTTKGQFTAPFANLTVANPTPTPNMTITYDCRGVGLTDGQKWSTIRAVDLAGNPSANAQPDPSAVPDGATQGDGIPFVFDALKPSGAIGLKLSP